MSQLIYELNQVLDRVLVIAPTQKRLQSFFQNIADDLVINLGQDQNLNFVSTRLDNGPIQSWMAVDMGNRSGFQSRVQFLGLSIENNLPSKGLLLANDALVLCWDPGNKDDDKLMSLKLTQHNKSHPCMAYIDSANPGVLPNDPVALLRAKAQKRSLERRLQKFMVCQHPDDFLRQGLEWILSF